jgi:hypothetical protein
MFAYAIRFCFVRITRLFFSFFFLSLWKKAEGHRQNNERAFLSSVSIAYT